MRDVVVVETAEHRIRNWAEQAEACYRDGLPELVNLCLREMAVAAYEGDREIRWFEDEHE